MGAESRSPRLEAASVGVRHGEVTALADVGLTVLEGDVLGLVGPNGSGKSSLLRLLGGLAEPSTGRVCLDGRAMSRVPARERARTVAFVGQDEHSDMPFTAREVLLLGRSHHRRDWQGYGSADHDAVDRVLADLGIGHLADRTLDRMSGGERQRVLVARALAQESAVLLLDEPTNHLDVRYQHDVLRVVTQRPVTVVVVLHDLNLAARYCSRLAMLDRGRLVAQGTAAEVLQADRVADVYGVRTRTFDLDRRRHLVLGD